MRKRRLVNNKGFSLVELIIVIAIMAILIGVMAPNLVRYIERTNVSGDIQVANALRTAIMTAMMDPNSDDAAGTLPANAVKGHFITVTAAAAATSDGVRLTNATLRSGRFTDDIALTLGIPIVDAATGDSLNVTGADIETELIGRLRSTLAPGADVVQIFADMDATGNVIVTIHGTDQSGGRSPAVGQNANNISVGN
jgi:prepilin-type N-terminal cleavage/methylation domain-containing protein